MRQRALRFQSSRNGGGHGSPIKPGAAQSEAGPMRKYGSDQLSLRGFRLDRGPGLTAHREKQTFHSRSAPLIPASGFRVSADLPVSCRSVTAVPFKPFPVRRFAKYFLLRAHNHCRVRKQKVSDSHRGRAPYPPGVDSPSLSRSARFLVTSVVGKEDQCVSHGPLWSALTTYLNVDGQQNLDSVRKFARFRLSPLASGLPPQAHREANVANPAGR